MLLPPLPGAGAPALRIARGPRAVVGGSVWPAAAALCRHLLEQRGRGDGLLGPGVRSVVELGSGTGAVGLYYAALAAASSDDGASSPPAARRRRLVALTEQRPLMLAVLDSLPYSVDGVPEDWYHGDDGGLWRDGDGAGGNGGGGGGGGDARRSDRLLRLLRENVGRNLPLLRAGGARPPIVEELEWGDARHVARLRSLASAPRGGGDGRDEGEGGGAGGYDLILGSDVTYHSALHDALAETAAGLLAGGGDGGGDDGAFAPRMILSHERRAVHPWTGDDLQLPSFFAAARRAGLDVVGETSVEVVADGPPEILHGVPGEANESHDIRIIEVRRAA